MKKCSLFLISLLCGMSMWAYNGTPNNPNDPGNPHALPGMIEAEWYDNGGEGVAFHSSQGGFTDEPGCGGASGGNSLRNFGDSQGDWLIYTISSETEGDYNLIVRMRYGNCCGKFTLFLDDEDISGGPMDIVNGGWDCNPTAWNNHIIRNLHIIDGTHTLKIRMDVGNPNLDNITFEPAVYTGTPNNPDNGNAPHAIPGTIEAEHFDNGGRGVAYRITPETNDISIVEYPEDSGDKWIQGFGDSKGDWVKYSVNAATEGYYTVKVRLRYGNCCGKLSFFVDDVRKDIMGIPETNNWDPRELTGGNVYFESGNHVLKVESSVGFAYIDKITFTPAVTSPYNPENDNAPHAIPGIIEAEWFDAGGEGLAYHDTSKDIPGNANDRGEHVGLESNDNASNGKHVCYTSGGEWLKYTFAAAQAGTYDISFTFTNGDNDTGRGFTVDIDGEEIADEYAPTPGWGNYEDVTVSGVDIAAGTHVLTFRVVNGGFNFDKMTFEAVETNGIQQINAENGFYLNQTQNVLYFTAGKGEVSIFDLTGKKVLAGASLSGQLNVNSLQKGVYIVRVQSNGKTITGKIVK